MDVLDIDVLMSNDIENRIEAESYMNEKFGNINKALLDVYVEGDMVMLNYSGTLIVREGVTSIAHEKYHLNRVYTFI